MHRKTMWQQLCAPCERKQAVMFAATKSNLSPVWSASQAISEAKIRLYPNAGHTEKEHGNNSTPQ